MNAKAINSDFDSAPSIWRDPAAWIRTADILAVLLAASLPWSTTLVAIFAIMFALSLIPTFDIVRFIRSAKRPSSVLPLMLFALAVVGMLWATDIPWAARVQGLNPLLKLVAIPLLIYHFERSMRGMWVIVAFALSCSVILMLSWFMFAAGITWTLSQGVPVKNYIAQSQEFALCAFGALGAAYFCQLDGRKTLALSLALFACALIANIVFVVSSRTVLVCIPILAILFAFRFLRRTGVAIFFVAAGSAAVLAWFASPDLRDRVVRATLEYREYEMNNAITSTGERLEFWRKSLGFIAASPLIGHGTGSTKTLFERDAVGQTGVAARVIGNPHNQTLNVAVQWGLIGCAVLYAMWFAHALAFQGLSLVAWIGLVAVVENFVSSIFNSHIFDFTEGWMYVLSVGVGAGMLRRSCVTVEYNLALSARAMGSQDTAR